MALPLALIELAILAQSRRQPRGDEDNSAWITIAIWVGIIAIGSVSSWWKQRREANARAAQAERRSLERGYSPGSSGQPEQAMRPIVIPDPEPVEAERDRDPDPFERLEEAPAYRWEEEGAPGRPEIDAAAMTPHSNERMCATAGAQAAAVALTFDIAFPPVPVPVPSSGTEAAHALLPKQMAARFTEAQLMLIGREIFDRPGARGRGRAPR